MEAFPDDRAWTECDYFGGNRSLLKEGSFPRWQGVILVEGMILCSKESSCDMEGIVPWWWKEAFPDDREWFFSRESSCNVEGIIP
jgi:hypothetical protein